MQLGSEPVLLKDKTDQETHHNFSSELLSAAFSFLFPRNAL